MNSKLRKQINYAKAAVVVGAISLLVVLFLFLGAGLLPKNFRYILEWLSPISVAIATLALFCAVIAYLKREDIRYVSVGAGLAGIALALNFIWLAIGLIIVLVVVVYFLSN